MTVNRSVYYLVVAFFIFFMSAGAFAQSAADDMNDPETTFENMDDPETTFDEEPAAAGETGFNYPNRFYIGITPYYTLEDFDHGDTRIYESTPDFDDTFGGGFKFGYSFYEAIDAIIVSLESELVYFHQFEWDSEKVSAEMNVAAAIGSFKVALAWRVSPFIQTGIGLMYSEAEVTEHDATYDDDEIDLCTRFGIGVDFFFNSHVAIETAAHYIQGFNNVDNLNFFKFGAGVNIYF